MARVSATLVLLLAIVGLVVADSTLSMSNTANQRFELSKGTDFTISNNGETFITLLADGTSVFNQGVRFTASQFGRPGAIRYQNGDLEAFLDSQWVSMTSTATRSPVAAAAKQSSVTRAVATAAAPEATLVQDGAEWHYAVEGRYIIGSTELNAAPVASQVNIHPVTGTNVVSIALEDSSVVTVSCNVGCTEAGVQVSHAKLSNAQSLTATFTEEEYQITTDAHTQSFSLDRVAPANCNSANAGTIETVAGQLMTCSSLDTVERANSAALFAYLSVIPENQF